MSQAGITKWGGKKKLTNLESQKMPIFQVRPENLIKQIPSNSGLKIALKLACRENDVEAVCTVELQDSLGKRWTSSLKDYSA